MLDLLPELAELGTLFLTLTGGEVLLRDDWPVIVEQARHQGFKVTLLSNGSLLDAAAASLLASLHVTVEISLYGGEQSFERVTRTAGSYRRTLQGLEHLVRHRAQVVLKAPLMTLNRHEAEAMRGLAEQLGLPYLPSTTLTARRDGDRSPLCLRTAGAEPTELTACCRRADRRPGPPQPAPGGTLDDWPLCAAGNRYACVTPAGEVLACNLLPRSAGNIRRRSFGEVWHGSSWLGYLRGLRVSDLPVCHTCHRLAYCGRCPAQALVEHGDLLVPVASACDRAAALEQTPGHQATSGPLPELAVNAP